MPLTSRISDEAKHYPNCKNRLAIKATPSERRMLSKRNKEFYAMVLSQVYAADYSKDEKSLFVWQKKDAT